MLPLKFNRMWHWENTWLIFSLVSLVILPCTLAVVFVNHLLQAYDSLTPPQFAVPSLFGAGWGVAQVLFGISIQRLGLGLAYAIVVGLGTLLGTLVPLFVQHRAQLDNAPIAAILVGISIVLIGIVLSGWAGQIRERCLEPGLALPSGRYQTTVFAAVLYGFLAPMLNYSFAFGHGRRDGSCFRHAARDWVDGTQYAGRWCEVAEEVHAAVDRNWRGGSRDYGSVRGGCDAGG